MRSEWVDRWMPAEQIYFKIQSPGLSGRFGGMRNLVMKKPITDNTPFRPRFFKINNDWRLPSIELTT